MASQVSLQRIPKFDLFREELHALLDNVLDEAESSQTTAGSPILLDGAWLLHKMKDHMANVEYILEPEATRFTLALGYLHKLPRELRNLIYGYAIADGSTAILRASKQTHKEASKFIFQNGIYRLVLGFGAHVINPPLSQSLARNIRNLNLRVNGQTFLINGLDKNLPILHMFYGSCIQRENCVMRIECDPFYSSMDASEAVGRLEHVTGFERVIIELDLEWRGERWPQTLDHYQKDYIWRRVEWATWHHKRLLEPTLGRGHVSYGEECCRRLTFHPRK